MLANLMNQHVFVEILWEETFKNLKPVHLGTFREMSAVMF
jgi:hypothetical protein